MIARSNATTTPELVLVRHGETEWSRNGRHTGRTDVPLTARGRTEALALAAPLRRWTFGLVLSSPLQRALETCRLAGLGDAALVRDDLSEWNYGEYEGLTTQEIRRTVPGWTLWTGGAPGGETAAHVGGRADRIIRESRATGCDVAVFAHGHLLRVLAARWLGLDADAGRLFALDPATISVLGYEHETPVIRRWNQDDSSSRTRPDSLRQ